jgi:hypothetical protein
MLKYWPIFLIAAYFLMLWASFRKSPNLFAEELKWFGWYLVVGLAAAFNTKYAEFAGVEFQLTAFCFAMWYELARPFIIAFVCLSLPRHLIVALLYWRKRKQSRELTVQ